MTPAYSDDVLLAELARLAIENDPIPAHVITQARASLAIASPWDSALAQLVYDSTIDGHDARALVRAGSSARELTFEGPTLTVEVEISPTEPVRAGRCRILGQLVPASSARVEVRHPNGALIAEADTLGRFAVLDAPSGPVSLRCTPTDGAATDTEWTVI